MCVLINIQKSNTAVSTKNQNTFLFSFAHRHLKLTHNSRTVPCFTTYTKMFTTICFFTYIYLSVDVVKQHPIFSQFKILLPLFISPNDILSCSQFRRTNRHCNCTRKHKKYSHVIITRSYSHVTSRDITPVQSNINNNDCGQWKYRKISKNMIHRSFHHRLHDLCYNLHTKIMNKCTYLASWQQASKQASWTCAKPPTLTSSLGFFLFKETWRNHHCVCFISFAAQDRI